MEFKDVLRKLRTEKGMTQEELGKMVGLKREAIYKYEKGIYDFRLLYTSFRHPGKLRLLMTNPAFEFEPLHPLLLSHSV